MGHTTFTLGDLVLKTIGLINLVLPVLFALAIVFFFWSLVRYVTQAGEGGGEVRGQILWGLLALFVIFTVWGLVNILCVTFLGASCSG